jgi:hypothetical protein
MLDSRLIRLLPATASLRLLSLAAFIAITTAATSCDAEVISIEGVVTGLDVVERVITLEQQRAAGKVIRLELDVTKEAWDKAQLAVGDRVILSYEPKLQTVIAVKKEAPPPPEELDRNRLKECVDSFLAKHQESITQYHNVMQENEPLFADWDRLHRPGAKVDFFKIDDWNLGNPGRELPAIRLRSAIEDARPRVRDAVKAENKVIDDLGSVAHKLYSDISPLARDGYEDDKREQLSRISQACPDLWELRVWEAMLWILDGQVDKANVSLSAISQRMEDSSFLTAKRRVRPVPPPFLYETAHMYVRALRMLQQNESLNTFILKWDKPPYPDDAYRQTMLLGKAARSMCLSKWPEATVGYRQAVRMAKDNDAGGWIYGEAAWLMAASPEAKDRDMEAATSYAEKALTLCGNSCWVAWRAKAAVCAAEGEWDEAAKCLDEAAQSIPLILAEDLKAQRLAYNGKQTFSITMP